MASCLRGCRTSPPAARSAEASAVCCLKLMLRGKRAAAASACRGVGRAGKCRASLGLSPGLRLHLQSVAFLAGCRGIRGANTWPMRHVCVCLWTNWQALSSRTRASSLSAPIEETERSLGAQRCQWFEHCRDPGAESSRKVDRAFKKSIDRSNDLGAAHQLSCTVDQMI